MQVPVRGVYVASNGFAFERDGIPSKATLVEADGVPLPERGLDYHGVFPDRIWIYRLPHCEVCEDEAELVEQVKVTVLHEIAHHFGIDDDHLDELGWA